MDCYQILGVPSDASVGALKKAYRRQALRHHPDRVGGSHRGFARVHQAYEAALKKAQAKKAPPEEAEESDDVYVGMTLQILSLKLDGLPVPSSFLEDAQLLQEETGLLMKVSFSKPWLRGAGNVDAVLGMEIDGRLESVVYSKEVLSRAYRGYGMVALWFSPA